MNEVIRVENLTKSFYYWSEHPETLKSFLVQLLKGEVQFSKKTLFTAIEDISFTVNKGDFIGIMGRNGAGKSTLFKLLSRIYQPTSGKIEINEIVAPLIELGAGFNIELTGYENIFLNATILGLKKAETRRRFDEIVAFSEIKPFIDTPVKRYSSGMLVRLGFAIAAFTD